MAMPDLKKVVYSSVVSALLMSSTAYAAPQMSKLPTSAWGLTDQNVLFNVNPYQPDVVVKSVSLTGLQGEDQLIGIDYRVARGDLYGLANSGRIYVINTSTGKASLVNGSDVVPEMAVGPYGFDFNPAADKLRVVGNKNRNLRLDPDSGAKVDFDKNISGIQTDPNLVFDSQDPMAGEFPDIVAAAYTYNPNDSKLTTNYAIDRRSGKLLMQGTKEGVLPSVSPNLGVLYTIGDLGTGPLKDASFDISDVSNTAFAALLSANEQETVLVEVDLLTGAASKVGTFGDGSHVVGFAIEP
ncbi:DUF4394 domain-containing protein [Marinomonas ostreistagni]|uniref:DUF4394 domain-containing protein n=1 Tax=Marinomonas ostreistagni TaxID=359209 RepID=A0ABS0Z8E9_9GAMM|nr:DUF4394 domain-containing protein [Marinomonas ostreistagni]MBJ7549904.1 DUF4394 domain-containing protein [Marinomonas ostreistagni]